MHNLQQRYILKRERERKRQTDRDRDAPSKYLEPPVQANSATILTCVSLTQNQFLCVFKTGHSPWIWKEAQQQLTTHYDMHAFNHSRTAFSGNGTRGQRRWCPATHCQRPRTGWGRPVALKPLHPTWTTTSTSSLETCESLSAFLFKSDVVAFPVYIVPVFSFCCYFILFAY